MSLQAIIMAGGEGVRLRPLTVHLPKPLVPLLGEPVMGYTLKLLKAHGVDQVGATLWYQPQRIKKAFGKGEGYQLRLRYFEEKEPMGTAGSLLMAKRELDKPFFVLSGDGLTDCDLTDAMRFHLKKQALATLVLKRVGVPLSYGVVMTDADSRITRFIEKPTWSRVFSDLVNTGTYILSPDIFQYIPDHGVPDFGKDVFPALLSGGLPVYGYETKGYWCDVGDLRTYLQAQQDLLNGKTRLPHASGVHESARIHPSAVIEGECFIGAGAAIGAGAVVSHSAVGERCAVGPGAALENACLWAGAEVQEKARVCGSVLCDGAVARQGAEISDGCAVGKKAVVGAYALLRPGVRIWPHMKAAPGAVVSRSLTGGDWNAPQWSPGGAECDSAQNACDLCGAFAKVTGAKQVLTACLNPSGLETIAAGALAAAGAQVWMAGEMPPPMLRTLIRVLRLDGGVYASSPQTLCFFQRQGLPLSAQKQSAMDSCVLRQEMQSSFFSGGAAVPFSGAEAVYLASVVPKEQHRALYSPIALFCDSRRLALLAGEAFRRIGARSFRFAPVSQAEVKENETGFLLPETGEDVTVFTADRTLSWEERTLLVLSLWHQTAGKLFDLEGVPRAAAQIAPLEAADHSEECVRQRELMQDGLASSLLIAEALKRASLEDMASRLPATHILSLDVPCAAQDKGRILHTLCDQVTLPYTMGEGIRIQHEGGYATIVPDALGGAVHIVSESADSEFAQELCDFYSKRVQNIAKGKKQFAISP